MLILVFFAFERVHTRTKSYFQGEREKTEKVEQRNGEERERKRKGHVSLQ